MKSQILLFKEIIEEMNSRKSDSGFECVYSKGHICEGCQHPECNGSSDNFILGAEDKKFIEKILSIGELYESRND